MDNKEIHRLFLGFKPSGEMQDRILRFMHEFQGVNKGFRWVQPENIHLTLLFLGNTPGARIPTVCEIIKKTAGSFPEITLTFQQITYAPPGTKKSMIWAIFNKHEKYSELVSDLSSAILHKELNHEPIPHVTLARFKQKPINEPQQVLLPPLECKEVYLWESQLTAEGPIYQPLYSFSLQTS